MVDSLSELIGMYGLDNIPKAIIQKRELNRWSKIMAEQRLIQDDLPYFQQQDDKEAFERHKQAMAKRWFSYYKKCKSKRNTILDQYNKIATMKQR